MEKKKNKVLSAIIVTLKKRFRLSYLLFMALLITGNSFAWFIYMNKVDSSIDVKVKAWNVSFHFDTETLTDLAVFNFEEIYPGMDESSQELSITNGGEVSAELYYEIQSLTIFGEEITENIDEKLAEYPFTITIDNDKDIIEAGGGTATFKVSISWDYESLDDEGNLKDDIDTYWGTKAYEYKSANPDSPCIELIVKLSATQINE